VWNDHQTRDGEKFINSLASGYFRGFSKKNT